MRVFPFLSLTCSATFLVAAALADPAPALGGSTPPAAPPAPSAASSTGVITSVNAQSLKAVFDEAGVPVEFKTNDKGYTFLIGQPPNAGYMIVYPMNCEGDSMTGKCPIVGMESGLWSVAITPEIANKFNQSARLSNAVIYDGNESKPIIEYTFAIDTGVSPQYIRAAFRNFVFDITGFQEFLNSLAAPPAAAPATAGFSSSSPSGGIGGSVALPTAARAGSPAAEIATGH